jgi:stalled ribosome alternative rescue factor ArfA
LGQGGGQRQGQYSESKKNVGDQGRFTIHEALLHDTMFLRIIENARAPRGENARKAHGRTPAGMPDFPVTALLTFM